MRQIVLDTETTGLETSQGHRIIEIGAVEMISRKLTGKTFHKYIQPQREIDDGALEVHGITTEFLADKPVFAEIADEFLTFIDGGELVIHNAPFDVGFMDYEFGLLNRDLGRTADHCRVLDTLVMARQKHPGQKNNLDALCKRYMVDNSSRELHGALLDARILALVYLAMTGGQVNLSLDESSDQGEGQESGAIAHTRVGREGLNFLIKRADEQECEAHKAYMMALQKEIGELQCPLWPEA